MSDTPKLQEAADGGCPPATCSPSLNPETDELRDLYENYEHRCNMEDLWELCASMERERDANRQLYETECKDHAFMRKTLERVIRERDKYRVTLKDIYTGHILRGAVQEKIEEALNFNVENADLSDRHE